MNLSEVRVRMAPSPTGFFHVGSARTALYNWLFAKHHKGKFILRVEDTDVKRSSADMIKVILEGLTWLGLTWDEEPSFQSQRIEIYKRYVDRLIEKKLAYYCYCDPEELAKEKQEAYKNKKDWQYDRRCLNLSDAERAEKEKAKIPKAVRFLVPDRPVVYNDIIHGEIKKEGRDIEDFIIMRANGIPTYNLACVVDDFEMGITHVIRAVEHINNTPKQLLLYEALGLPAPKFAHLPLILGTDKSKLSKRHGAVSLISYREQGFLPEAMVNYLALLGWAPGDDKEIMDKEELISRFTLERINPSNAVFDVNKLLWMNQQYILKMNESELIEHLKPYFIDAGLINEQEFETKKEWIKELCLLMQPRIKVLGDIVDLTVYFFTDDFEYEEDRLHKYTDKRTLELMERFLGKMDEVKNFNAQSLENLLRGFAAENKIKAKELIHPLRIFVTGRSSGAGLFKTLELLGKQRCIKRIQKIIRKYGGN